MKLVIAEKPSVAGSIAAALGVKEKKDGYIEGGGYLISWCVGHLVGYNLPLSTARTFDYPPPSILLPVNTQIPTASIGNSRLCRC